ncbi:MAG: CDP-alcohol phosphatidyltransferase family protein [Bacteroidales bacterium]|nr:CDP-alcohol phosphatidyltransferase family protein [Bacteroidales bacterium]
MNKSFIHNNLPNLITLLNLFAGCAGISLLIWGEVTSAAWCIAIAALFDFLDGFTARLLKAGSAIGKQLDSLADVVSFGVLPGLILFVLIRNAGDEANSASDALFSPALFAFAIPVFSAVRLARFNLDKRQQKYFLGVPTPANALLIASFPFILYRYDMSPGWLGNAMADFLGNYYILVSLSVILSILLVSGIRLFSLKFDGVQWSDNKQRYIFIILVAVFIVAGGVAAIPLVFPAYIILSLFFQASG